MHFDIQLLRRCCRHRKILQNESLLAKIGAKFPGKSRSAVGARTRVDPGDGAHALVADREAGVDAGVRAAQHLAARNYSRCESAFFRNLANVCNILESSLSTVSTPIFSIKLINSRALLIFGSDRTFRTV